METASWAPQPGDACFSRHGSHYYAARVTQFTSHSYKIHYDGFGKRHDHWTGRDHLRPTDWDFELDEETTLAAPVAPRGAGAPPPPVDPSPPADPSPRPPWCNTPPPGAACCQTAFRPHFPGKPAAVCDRSLFAGGVANANGGNRNCVR